MLIPGEYQNAVPKAQLGVIALPGCETMAADINDYLVKWRKPHATKLSKGHPRREHYAQDSYLINASIERFATGEAKAVIKESVRGHDLFVLCDCFNYGVTHKMYGMHCPTSPDEHFANLKRMIGAAAGKEQRLTVIMPMLYEGRQDCRYGRESLDCAMALQELAGLGVVNIITFDAHNPRVSNAIPNCGFESVPPIYQMIKAIVNHVPDINIDKENLMVISPDEGGIKRCMSYANVLGVDLGMFYKQRDYSRVEDGRNPVVAHQFLGSNVQGKDVIVVDDMISSGGSVIEVCKQLRDHGASRVFVCTAFGLFSSGLAPMDRAYEDGLFDKVFTCDMIYTPEELRARPWHVSVRMSKYIAFIIDTMNHDKSISRLLTPTDRINRLLVNRGYRIG